jgi:copper oxidase (laccase) domain-containing protein
MTPSMTKVSATRSDSLPSLWLVRLTLNRRLLQDYVNDNLEHYGHQLGFDPRKITWPNGDWPHSGQTIKGEDYVWEPHPRVHGLVPFTRDGRQPVTYDAITTRSTPFVLGVQGADCPTIFLCDPLVGVIGLAHAGWRPTVRGVVGSTVSAMTDLGAKPTDIVAFIGPGVGDKYNEFRFDGSMEGDIREVFVTAGREDLLHDMTVRYEMSEEDIRELGRIIGRIQGSGIAFRLEEVIVRELVKSGLSKENITESSHSTVINQYPDGNGAFMFHSARRDKGPDPERPGNGLSLSTIFLKSAA